MCLRPVLIKNQSRMYRGKVDCLTSFHDTKSQYVYVPCGTCEQCVRLKQSYLVQRSMLEAMDNYLFFGTLTYSDEFLPTVDINGIYHHYADGRHFQNMMKRLRKSDFFRKFNDDEGNCHIKYLYVSEYGSRKHRPHFHFILFVPKTIEDNCFTPLEYERILKKLVLSEWSVNVGTTRCPIYKPLCVYTCQHNHGRFSTNYDLHYVNPLLTKGQQSDAVFYATKYCLKYDSWLERKRVALWKNLPLDDYYKFWKLLKPIMRTSKHFGLSASARKYVRDCIELYSDKSLYPLFRNPVTGQLFPMSPYLFNKYGTLYDKYTFYYRDKNPDSDNDSFRYSSIDYNEYQNKVDKFLFQNSCIQSYD